MSKIVKVTIDYDEFASSPCEEEGWKLYSFNPQDHDFRDPKTLTSRINKHGMSIPNIGLLRKFGVGTAFVLLYDEHGPICRWALSGEEWNTRNVSGFLIWEQPIDNLGPRTYEDRQEDARKFLEIYTDWCNGSNYNICVEYEDGETESVGGYTGIDNLMAGLKEEFPEIFVKGTDKIRDDIKIDGSERDFLR